MGTENQHMKPGIKPVACAAASLALLAAAGLSGCAQETPSIARSSSNASSQSAGSSAGEISGVAATVDDIEITEQEVSDYIQQYRLYSGAEEDDDWATLLDEAGTTPETLRSQAIEKIAGDKLVEKKAQESGVEASDDEVDEVVSASKKAAGTEDDASWKALLDTSGYTEDNYRSDIRLGILIDKLVAQDPSLTSEASEAALQNLAQEYPDSYTGRRTIAVVYPSGGSGSAARFQNSIEEGTSESDFRASAAKEVDEGRASRVADEGWSCLSSDITSYEEEAIADAHAGDVVEYAESDGTYHVVYVAEEYSADLNGYPVLKDMPVDIRKRLEEDYSKNALDEAQSSYVSDLLSKAELVVNDMPDGLPYDVDLEESNYGSETTQEEDEAAAQELVNEHINELELTGTDSNGNTVSESLSGE